MGEQSAVGSPTRGGDDFGALVASVREFIDAVCASDAPESLQHDLIRTLGAASADLRGYTVGADDAPAGRRPDLPGQGHPLLPAVVLTDLSEGEVRAEVTFGPAHHGSGGAVHGGIVPLVYDDVLGRLAARAVVPVARTSSLEVKYRAITPVGRRLHLEGTIEEIQGRKIFASGSMTDGERVLTTAKALFVALRPDQP